MADPAKRADHLKRIAAAAERQSRALADRDAVILAAYFDDDGPGPTDIGRAAGLTKGRIMQIVQKAKAA